jgi:multicomponent Na+:H+ antiporter subunit A
VFVVLIVHAVIGAAVFPSGLRLGRRVFVIASIAPAATLIWLATKWSALLDGDVVVEHGEWVPRLGLAADLRLDGFSALMVLLIALIGLLVCVFSSGYYSPTNERVGRNAGLLVIFAGAMMVVVLADNLLLLYTGWELTSIVSYLLIGNEHTKPHARAAALQALLVTSFGGLAMLAGFVVLGQRAGTYGLQEIIASPPTGAAVNVGIVLVLVGAFAKSAQYPFHFWLPGAMAAPTPISAYLHSATMVKAGVFLIARLAPAFATTAVWKPVVLTVGVVTMICGGLRALRQSDLKLLLAYGTVSQLGFLVVLFGSGTPDAAAAGCVMLLAHALFKAALFMAVGTVDHHTGTRDLRLIPRLGRRWRAFSVAAVVSAASMAGVPLMFGFVSKEAGLQALLDAGAGGGWVLAGVVAASALTVAYSVRLVWGILGFASHGEDLAATAWTTSPDRGDRPSPLLLVPVVVLSAMTLAFGVAPRIVQDLQHSAASALDAAFQPATLAIWHGFGTALVLTIVALAAGGLLFVLRGPVESVLARGAVIPSGGIMYVRLLRGTNVAASKVTGVVQNGSLPIYVGVTLLTAAVVPGIVLLVAVEWPGWPDLVGDWGQVPIAISILGAALVAALVRRRFTAALFLGATGYAMAGLFAVQGAPDLALTQVAIETLSTVLFVLVLRRLPDRFERTSTRQRRVARLVISGVIGVTVFLFAIVSRASRTVEPVSGTMIERALPDGHGRNVVNVILVDIRGFDTMGEITVLVAAAIGAVALARVGRRRKVLDGSQ